MKALVLLAAAVLAACAAPAARPSPVSSLTARAGAALEARRESLVALRRDLHQHPELSGEEERTSGLIAARLEGLGFEVRRNVGGYGLVAILRGGRPGPTIAFRADMDAVRSDAPDPVSFASLRPGVRHICGHDIHATIGVALAEAFAAIQPDLPGSIMLVFQPSEEDAAGAARMIADNAFNETPQAIFAVHTAPYEIGQLAAAEERMMSARDRVLTTVRGPAEVAEAFRARLLALSTVTGFAAQPLGSDFVRVEAGPIRNEGETLRFGMVFSLATDSARQSARAAVAEATSELMRTHPGAHIETQYEAGWIPGVVNDPSIVRAAAASIRAELGPDAFVPLERISPVFSEDFGHMQALAPGAMFFLGVSNQERGWVGLPHSPDYVADEESIFVGARAMIRIMLDQAAST